MDTQLTLLESTKAALIKRIQSHPFLVRCRTGKVPLGELKIFLAQQGVYSSYFNRYLCAMMANLPSNGEVLKLAENLFEELGLAPDSPRPHHLIYRDMLDHFSLKLGETKPLAGTRLLIDTMFHYCRMPTPASGLGAIGLGAEALVPAMYSDIIKGFEAHGIRADEIEFFHLHVACDDGHADTIRDIMVEIAARDPSQIERMVEAGTQLVEARLSFFSSIEEEFQRQTQGEPALA